jgi:hypothetical protein
MKGEAMGRFVIVAYAPKPGMTDQQFPVKK